MTEMKKGKGHSGRALIISYHFPPSMEVGGLRAANFARHLPNCRWACSVLTLDRRFLKKSDLKRLEGLESVRLLESGKWPTFLDLYRFLKKSFQWVKGRTVPGETLKLGKRLEPVNGKPSVESIKARLRRYVLSFLKLPDGERGWVPPASIAAIREIRRGGITCILTSCPPYSVHLIGLVVKKITGVRWIADFRDPWMSGGSKKLYATCRWSLGIEKWLESKVVKNADRIITNTERLCLRMREEYPLEARDKFVFISNGIDLDWFKQFDSIPKDPVFTITYTGSLYFGRTPEPIFRAIRELVDEGRVKPGEIRVRLVGDCRKVEDNPIDKMIQAYSLEGSVDVVDQVSYIEALEYNKRSQLALLLAPDQPLQIPGKVYDCLGLGGRVLALAGDGATADLVQTLKIGSVFSPSDTKGIKQFLESSLRSPEGPSAEFFNPNFREYDSRNIAGKLASELDSLSR